MSLVDLENYLSDGHKVTDVHISAFQDSTRVTQFRQGGKVITEQTLNSKHKAIFWILVTTM